MMGPFTYELAFLPFRQPCLVGLKNKLTASLQGGKKTTTECPVCDTKPYDSESYGECRVPQHCHYSQLYFETHWCYMLVCIYTCIYMQNNSQRHNDKGRAKTSLKIYTTHFIVRVRKGYSRFYCERELETEQNSNILTHLLWLSGLCLSRSPDA